MRMLSTHAGFDGESFIIAVAKGDWKAVQSAERRQAREQHCYKDMAFRPGMGC